MKTSGIVWTGLVIMALAGGVCWRLAGLEWRKTLHVPGKTGEASRVRKGVLPEVRAMVDPGETRATGRVDDAGDGLRPMGPDVRMERVRDDVLAALGYGSRTGFKGRLDAVHRLDDRLNQDEVGVLRDYLRTHHEDLEGMRIREHEAIRNDILDKLLRQQELPEGLGLQLVEMYEDLGHNNVWRDYCLQYMRLYLEAKESTEQEPHEDPERDAIVKTYWDATKEVGNTMAGTALIGLHALSTMSSGVEQSNVVACVTGMVVNPLCRSPSKITAFAIAREMKLKDAASEARIVAQAGETSTLRMAAIRCLEEVGGSDDVDLLRALATDPDARVARVAAEAVKALESTL